MIRFMIKIAVIVGILAFLQSSYLKSDCEIAGKHFWDTSTPSNNYVQCTGKSYPNGHGCDCPRGYRLQLMCRDNENGIKHFRYTCVPKRTALCDFDESFTEFYPVPTTEPNTYRYAQCSRGTHWDDINNQCVCDDVDRYQLVKLCETSKAGRMANSPVPATIIQTIWGAEP